MNSSPLSTEVKTSMECVPALIALGNVRDSQGLSAPSRNKCKQVPGFIYIKSKKKQTKKTQNSFMVWENFNDTIDQLDLIDIYRTFHPKTMNSNLLEDRSHPGP